MSAESLVHFAQGYASSSFRLLEVDEQVLQELLRDDKTLSVKGTRNDEAVLCTGDKTYTLRLAESSNQMLLAPSRGTKRPLEAEEAGGKPAEANVLEVKASVSAHFELRRCAPRTGELLALLSASPYLGVKDAAPPADDAAAAGRRFELAELETAVQSSRAELRAALQEARALPVADRWCVLDVQLEQDIVESVLSFCTENEWPLTAVPVAECVRRCLEQFPDSFDELSVRHCLRTHSTLAAAGFDEWCAALDLEHVALETGAVSRFRARGLLAECNVWPRDKFFEAWADAMPVGQAPDPEHLSGLAITLQPAGSGTDEPTVRSLPASELSRVPKERFASLFAVKRTWTLDELLPYVNPLLDPGAGAVKLVNAHARSVTANDGSVTYVSRGSSGAQV